MGVLKVLLTWSPPSLDPSYASSSHLSGLWDGRCCWRMEEEAGRDFKELCLLPFVKGSCFD